MTDPGEAAPPAEAESPRPGRRAAAITASVLTLPIALIAGVGVFAYLGGFSGGSDKAAPAKPATGPVAVTAPPSSVATDPVCAGLLNALPRTLDGKGARPVSDAPDRVAAWGDPPIVLRCGVGKPKNARPESLELVINGVAWLYDEDGQTAVWTTNKRAVYVEVRIPAAFKETGSQRIINPLAAPIKAAVPPGK